ncbi:hypothetical protein N9Y42_06390 [Mariniblastus sp.]|nr:hypothetical protein [Mariniblastus sp.]
MWCYLDRDSTHFRADWAKAEYKYKSEVRFEVTGQSMLEAFKPFVPGRAPLTWGIDHPKTFVPVGMAGKL